MKMRSLIFFVTILLLMPVFPGSEWMILSADALEVGVAEIDITPPVGMPMRGYAARKELSNGMWDPLLAKALVMDDGETCAAMVTLDLIAPPPKEVQEQVYAKVQERYGIDKVLYLASHTHSGPSLKEDLPSAEEPWLETLGSKLQEVIGKAVEMKREARVAVGDGSCAISYDRREVQPDGSVKMLFQNPERKEPTPVDQTVGLVGFQDGEEKWIALLVHYACHPVIFGSKNLKYTADFVGAMRDRVEEEIGGTCLFVQGACGDVNPFERGDSTEEGYAVLRGEGKKLGEAVIRIVPSMRFLDDESLELTATGYVTDFDYRFDLKDEKVKEFYVKRYGKEYVEERYKDRPPMLEVETPFVMLGDSIAWVGFPGEFFNDFQIDLKKRSPIPHTFFAGYCNAVHSYFPTIRAAVDGGYGASYATYVEVGAGERLVDQAVITLYELMGKLKKVPTN